MRPSVLLAALFLSGCSAAVVSSAPLKRVSFTETDGSGHIVQEISFELTNEAGHACIGGEWKKAKLIKEFRKYTHDPVYKVENGKFEVLLINNICDSYDSYIGQVSDGQFKGEHVVYGWGSKTLGIVTGVYTE